MGRRRYKDELKLLRKQVHIPWSFEIYHLTLRIRKQQRKYGYDRTESIEFYMKSSME